MESTGTPGGSSRFTRALTFSGKALLAAGMALVAFLPAACGGADSSAPSQPTPSEVSLEQMTELTEASTFGNLSDVVLDSQPQSATDGEVIHPKSDLVVYREAGGTPIAKLPVIQMGSDTWVPVISRQGDWAQILLPTRPNGSTGWVHASPDKVESSHNEYVVNVDLKAFKLEIKQNGNSVGSWAIGIGKSEHPTPAGRAYTIALIKETVNKYSPYVLPLSYHSNSLETFGGGVGTVGIHGWPDDSFVGKENSDGCIRVPKDALNRLIELPLGTIVNIA